LLIDPETQLYIIYYIIMTVFAESMIILTVFVLVIGWQILKLAYEDEWPFN